MNTIFNFSESDPHVSAKGSSQDFKKVYMDFENWCSRTEDSEDTIILLSASNL